MPEIRIPITGDASKFSREAAKVDKDLAKIGKQATKTSKEVKSASDRLDGWAKGAAAGVGVGMVVRGLDQAIDSAMRLNTQVKTSERVFGDAADEIDRVGRTSASAFGLSEEAFRLQSNRLGAMTTNLGYTKQEAAALSASMVGVAADMGAAFGESPERAIEAIGAAMRGERDPIEAFGISLKQVDINAKVAALGLDTSTSASKKHAEAVASVALIQEQAAKTAGAFADGVEDGSQAATVAAAKWDNAMAKIGKALIPVKKGLADLASDAVDVFTGYSDAADTYRDNTVLTTKAIDDEAKAREYLARITTEAEKADREAAEATNFLGGALNAQAPTYKALAAALDGALVQSRQYVESVLDRAKADGVSYAEAKRRIDQEKRGEEQSQKTTEQLEAERDALRKQIKPVKDLGDAWGDAASAMGRYFDDSTEFSDAQNESKDAWAEWIALVRESGNQFDWNTGKVNTNTEAGREQDRQLKDLARTLAEQDLAWAKQEGSIELGAKALAAHREEMIRNMTAVGWSREAAEKYLNTIGMVPEQIVTTWEQQGLVESIEAAKNLTYWVERMASQGGAGGTALAGIANVLNLPRRAVGGGAAGPTVVGERGWEIVDLPAGSRVRSHSESVAAMAGSSAPTVVHAHLHLNGREIADALVDVQGGWN